MIPSDDTAHPVHEQTARKTDTLPRHWVITAVVIGMLMTLTAWPLPTVLGLVAAAGWGLILAAIWALLSVRAKRERCGGGCAEGHTYGGQCELAPLIDEAPAIWRLGDDATPTRCCVCGSPNAVYENYLGQWFCWPCADCSCDQLLCVRTGINDPAVSSDAAAADGPLAGAGTSGSKGREATTPAGPEGVSGSDGALTGDSTGREQLRDAIATALLARIKEAVIPAWALPGQIGSLFAATEYDLADEALRVVRPHLATPVERDADALAAIQAKQAAARRMSCGHDATSSCERCDATERAWRTELAAAYWELQLAVAHDRQPYPTAEAYTAACAALQRHRDRADAAEAERAEAVTAAVRARKAAEQRARTAEAAAEAWQASDVIARVRVLAERWERGHAPDFHYARSLYAALNGPVVQADGEQPVSDPQPVDESDADSCQVVHVTSAQDGET